MSDDPFLPKIILLAVLVLLNAFFAAAEFAILSLSESRLKKQAEEGDKKSARLLSLVQAPDNFLPAIRTAITLAGYLSSAIAADSFARPLARFLAEERGFTAIPAETLHGLMVALITLVLSCCSLVLGELAPKRLAMTKTEAVARAVAVPVTLLTALFQPLVWLLNKSANGVLRLLGVDPKARAERVSEDEIRQMVDLGEENGAIESNEKELIENIFEFNNTTAGDVMVHRTDMILLPAGETDENILTAIRASGLSRFPVYKTDADDIIGILNTRDYLLNAQLPHPRPARELLRPAYFVPESVRTDLLFRDMQSRKVHMAIVVDEYGGTSGLVTMEDLLEEIVGNIYDEFDPQEEVDIEPLEENLWRVSGACPLDQLSRALGLELSEELESDTLGGLVFAQLSVLPEDGAQLEVEACGLRIQVTSFNDRRVDWALVSRLQGASPGESQA